MLRCTRSLLVAVVALQLTLCSLAKVTTKTHELSTIRTYPIVMECSMDAGAGHST